MLTMKISTCFSFSHKRTSCKLKLTILLVFLSSQCFLIESVEGTEKENVVYNGQIPSDDSQRISILIDKPGETQNELRSANPETRNSINADEGGGEGGGDSGTPTISQTVGFDKCNGPSSNCCFQYTWTGYQPYDSIPATANTTCDYLKKSKNDDSIGCYDPIVYTESTLTDPQGTPPNMTVLRKMAETNNWNMYCVMAGQTCITYTIFNRGDNQKATNQTKFCGTVTNTNTGKQITKGCYSENVDGFIKQVCVCKTRLCNGSSSLSQSHLILLVSFVSVLIQLVIR